MNIKKMDRQKINSALIKVAKGKIRGGMLARGAGKIVGGVKRFVGSATTGVKDFAENQRRLYRLAENPEEAGRILPVQKHFDVQKPKLIDEIKAKNPDMPDKQVNELAKEIHNERWNNLGQLSPRQQRKFKRKLKKEKVQKRYKKLEADQLSAKSNQYNSEQTKKRWIGGVHQAVGVGAIGLPLVVGAKAIGDVVGQADQQYGGGSILNRF